MSTGRHSGSVYGFRPAANVTAHQNGKLRRPLLAALVTAESDRAAARIALLNAMPTAGHPGVRGRAGFELGHSPLAAGNGQRNQYVESRRSAGRCPP